MNEQFVQWIFSQVEKKGISFREMERQTGIASSTISAWTTGKTEPSAYSINRLAQFFDVDVRKVYEMLGRVEPVKIVELDDTERRLIESYRSLNSNQRRLFVRLSEAIIGYDVEQSQAEQQRSTQKPVEP